LEGKSGGHFLSKKMFHFAGARNRRPFVNKNFFFLLVQSFGSLDQAIDNSKAGKKYVYIFFLWMGDTTWYEEGFLHILFFFTSGKKKVCGC